ncbi:MAG: hypothetical protein AUK47_25955 [Deltaproteobacteria bacterium CG2_30_63_29]|nr:MAG: hypothetical protein AUK47_25955 [Deltaproteobacteria bacterium CG2_30_63_29]PIV98195.1 MAG: hypothetical protein COW42_16050 [Deltaproteobacteria bacterium CG17_big_fil_post_rev_8_21_14_2_50_63_7]PJB37318.1 MAG: hypothetical protein CO108_21390 [Deltaproteobacteria bacterium CG_4_9_14_3_um_filter_63_12]
MNSLKDALQLSGLVNDKKRRKLEHEQRNKQKKQATEAPNLGAVEPEEAPVLAYLLRVKRIIEEGRLDDAEGRKRFHFVAQDGRIPFLNVNDVVSIRLQRGMLAIVEDLEGHPVIITRDAAIKLLAEEPERVRFFLKGGSTRSD